MYTCCKSERRGWMGSSRAGRVRRHAIEWDAGLRREGGTRAWTKAYRKNSPLSYFTRTTSDARPPSHSRRPHRPLPSTFPLSSATFPAARHPHPSHPLSRALSPYQIESLYFASSIISFINLRAFRTLWGPLKAAR